MSSNNVQRVPSLKCSTPVLSNLVKEIYNFPLVQTSGQITSISSVRDAFPVSGDREHSVPSLLETGPNHLSSLQPQICKYLHHETIVSPHVSRLSLLATPHPLNSRSKPIASYPKQDLKSKNHSLSRSLSSGDYPLSGQIANKFATMDPYPPFGKWKNVFISPRWTDLCGSNDLIAVLFSLDIPNIDFWFVVSGRSWKVMRLVK